MVLYFPLIWQEYIEIGLIAFIIYNVSVWLRKDKHTPLLGYAYMYGMVVCAAYALELHAVITLLPIVTPLFFIVGVIIHQDILQKNIVTHKHITYKTPLDPQWLELIFSKSLTHINKQKQIILLIEHTDDISPFISTSFKLYNAIHKDLLDICMHPSVFDGSYMIWIQSSGTLISSHALWHQQQQGTLPDTDMQQELSLLYTRKTDALVCTIDQQQRTCTLLIYGKTISLLTTHNACQLIRKHIQTLDTSVNVQRNQRESYTQNPDL